MSARYRQDGGQFHCYDDFEKVENDEVVLDDKGVPVLEEKLLYSSAEVAVAYCKLPDRLHIFTHGTPDNMAAWVATNNASNEHKAELRTFDQSTPLDVLNAVIVDPAALAAQL